MWKDIPLHNNQGRSSNPKQGSRPFRTQISILFHQFKTIASMTISSILLSPTNVLTSSMKTMNLKEGCRIWNSSKNRSLLWELSLTTTVNWCHLRRWESLASWGSHHRLHILRQEDACRFCSKPLHAWMKNSDRSRTKKYSKIGTRSSSTWIPSKVKCRSSDYPNWGNIVTITTNTSIETHS